MYVVSGCRSTVSNTFGQSVIHHIFKKYQYGFNI